MAHAFNSNTQKAEAGGPLRPAWSTEWVLGHPKPHRKTLTQKAKPKKKKKKKGQSQVVVVHSLLISALWRQRQEDLRELESSLVYRVGSRPTRGTQ